MIVVSPSLVLTETETGGPNHPVILWDNLVTAVGITADEEDALYPASNLATASTSERWQGETTDEQYITFTVSSENELEAVGIARPNFGGVTSVSLEYPDPDNPGDWLELIEPFIPADNAPILMRFEPTFLTQFRIRLQPTTVIPRMSVVYAGPLLVLQRKIYVDHPPITLSRSTDVQHNWSESGDFLGSITLRTRSQTAFAQRNLTPVWVRSDLKPYLDVCRARPVFFAWRPADYPLEVGYLIATNDPKPTNQRSNGMMAAEFQFGGIAP